ncbi:MAG TPA: type II toxin-antitoxin system Phd/YefM family antitoxin [Polyangiaceae bacterium]|nr:type II toxin-antitoxin system Phd/YefM family antitoxin [Polyangiaceae bacterium]
MKLVNVQAAKTHLSRLLEDAIGGEDIVIAKAGKPYVRLTPFRPDTTPRVLGGWEGRVWIADDFDLPDERIVRMFEGGSVEPSRDSVEPPRRTATKRKRRR